MLWAPEWQGLSPPLPAHVRKQYSFTISSSIYCDALRDLLSAYSLRGVQVVLTWYLAYTTLDSREHCGQTAI